MVLYLNHSFSVRILQNSLFGQQNFLPRVEYQALEWKINTDFQFWETDIEKNKTKTKIKTVVIIPQIHHFQALCPTFFNRLSLFVLCCRPSIKGSFAFGAPVTILRLTGGIPGKQAIRHDALYWWWPQSQESIYRAALESPSWCLQYVDVSAISDITGSQGPRLSPVSDCRGHRVSNRLRRRGGMAWEVLEVRPGGICCRGGSEPGPSQESLWGRRSWAGYLGCWVGAGGGGRRLSMKPMRDMLTTAYCPPCQAGLCGYASGLVAPLMWQNACHRDPQQTPNYRREAAVHWGAWNRRCRGGGTGRGCCWRTRSLSAGNGGGGRGKPGGNQTWDWRDRGRRWSSYFLLGGVHWGRSDSTGPDISPASGTEVKLQSAG